MSDTSQLARRQSGSRLLITGGVLIGVAAALRLAGLIFATAAVVTVARERVVRTDVPPTELAQRQWRAGRGHGQRRYLRPATGVNDPKRVG